MIESDEDADFYETLLLREDGFLCIGAMTMEWIALAIQYRSHVAYSEIPSDSRVLDILAQYRLFDYLVKLMEISDYDLALSEGEELEGMCEECSNEPIEVLVKFEGSGLFELDLPQGFVFDFMEDTSEGSEDLGEYLTYKGFGDETVFSDVLVSLAGFKRLKGQSEFTFASS